MIAPGSPSRTRSGPLPCEASECIERLPRAGDQERDQLVHQRQLVRGDPERREPVRTNPVTARRDERDRAALLDDRRDMRRHVPQRALALEPVAGIFASLHLSGQAAQGGPIERQQVRMVTLHLHLEGHLVGLLHQGPRRCERREEAGVVDAEQAIEPHLGHAQLRGELPRDAAVRDGRGLQGERVLGELVELSHGLRKDRGTCRGRQRAGSVHARELERMVALGNLVSGLATSSATAQRRTPSADARRSDPRASQTIVGAASDGLAWRRR
jgi:hypothetical protein